MRGARRLDPVRSSLFAATLTECGSYVCETAHSRGVTFSRSWAKTNLGRWPLRAARTATVTRTRFHGVQQFPASNSISAFWIAALSGKWASRVGLNSLGVQNLPAPASIPNFSIN